MSANASPAKDDPNLVSDTKAVLDRLVDLVTKDEDEASSQEDSGRCSMGSQCDIGQVGVVADQEVEDQSVCGYSLVPSLSEDWGSSRSLESLDDVLSSPIPMSEGSTDSFYIDDDLYPSSSEEPQFSDDFLPRDTSPETVGQVSSDEDEGGDDVRQGLVAEVLFLERMMLFFMDAGILDVQPDDLEQMGSGDHGQEHELD